MRAVRTTWLSSDIVCSPVLLPHRMLLDTCRYATGWGGGFMAFFAVLLADVDSPTGATARPSHFSFSQSLRNTMSLWSGGGTAYWPRSHLANYGYFRKHPAKFDGSYLFSEPVLSGGHVALLDGDSTVGEVRCFTGKAGDAMCAVRRRTCYSHARCQ